MSLHDNNDGKKDSLDPASVEFSLDNVPDVHPLMGESLNDPLDTPESFEMLESEDPMSSTTSRPGTNGSDLVRSIQWRSHKVKVYPLDYQKVSLVKWQIATCYVMFMVFGFNDQSMGTLLPTVMEYYSVTKVQVSNMFIVQLSGYVCASLLTEKIYTASGMRGCMLLSAILCMVFFLVLMSKPVNFFIFMMCCFPLGLGIGILDASCNVLMGNMLVHKNELMGIMHAVYGCAAMLTPPLVAHFVEWGHWSMYYVLPFSIAVLGCILTIPSFRYETAAKYAYVCEQEARDQAERDGTPLPGDNADIPQEKESFMQLIKMPAISLYAMFLFAYIGAEIATGVWFYTYLLETKSADPIAMSYVAATFWVGLTVGRLVLGFVTKRIFTNEYRACRVYCVLSVVFYSAWVVVGLFHGSSTAYMLLLSFVMFCCGFFVGPLFPSASIVAVQVLPKKLQISGVGIAVALGGCGGAFLPYMSGILSHWVGVQWIPTFCWLMVASFSVVWFAYPHYIRGHDEFL